MNALVAEGLEIIEQVVASADPGRIELAVGEVSRNLQGRIDRASAIIHGDIDQLDQSAVDSLFP